MLIIKFFQKPKLSHIILFIILNTIIFCKTSKCQFQPLLDDCTIVTDKQVIKPVHIQSPWQPEYLTESFSIIIEEKMVKALSFKTRELLWKVTSPDGIPLSWLGTQANIAYFCKGYTGSIWKHEDYENPPRIYRLDLKNRKWMEELVVSKTLTDVEKNKAILVDVLMGENEFVTLTVILSDDNELLSYYLMCFEIGKGLPKWAKSFNSTGSRPRSGAYLMSEYFGPPSTRSNIQYLSWYGEHEVLVCAGPVQDIICLSQETGEVCWYVSKIWEFERGFVGPSVWKHHMARFGLEDYYPYMEYSDPNDEQNYENNIEKLRKDFNTHYKGMIVGGPVVDDDYAIFVAIGKAPAHSYVEYLSDCIIYKLEDEIYEEMDEITPRALVKIPQMVNGHNYHILNNSIIWSCQNNSFVKINSFSEVNCIASVEWFRSIREKTLKPWLKTDRVNDFCVFTKTHAFRQIGGGYVGDENDNIYRFPIAVVDLVSGLSEIVTLIIPCSKNIPKPGDNINYSHTYSIVNNYSRYKISGPYLLGITHLEIVDDRLRIVIGMENYSASIDFPISNFNFTTN